MNSPPVRMSDNPSCAVRHGFDPVRASSAAATVTLAVACADTVNASVSVTVAVTVLVNVPSVGGVAVHVYVHVSPGSRVPLELASPPVNASGVLQLFSTRATPGLGVPVPVFFTVIVKVTWLPA